MILAIDPGTTESAYVILDKDLKPVIFGKYDNEMILKMIYATNPPDSNEGRVTDCAIEMVASYGMAVGKEVFETVYWIGRFREAITFTENIKLIYRKEEKSNLCHSMKAKDSNIRQALIDRFGAVGTKKNQGWFYGVSKDVWAAVAVGVTYHDLYIKQQQ